MFAFFREIHDHLKNIFSENLEKAYSKLHAMNTYLLRYKKMQNFYQNYFQNQILILHKKEKMKKLTGICIQLPRQNVMFFWKNLMQKE